jgi:hypothetical protein
MSGRVRVLILGCSFSADSDQSGWTKSNFHNHYTKILEKRTAWLITNRAIGGCSNREISLRTVENCLLEPYDFCIVQWSSLHRYWLYEKENNIDSETQILPRCTGWGDMKDAKLLSKILVSRYLNDYVALKHWLLDQISIQEFLKQKKIPYVFVKGFPNFISDLEYICQQGSFNSFSEVILSDRIKKMLNFDANPDDYLFKKLSNLVILYQNIDKSFCIGYNNNDTIYGMDPQKYQDDYADDGKHPGKIRNSFLAESILEHCKIKGIQI